VTISRLAPIAAADDDVDVRRLRARPGAKWRVPPDDVLPAWVADMDFPVAEPIRAALHGLVEGADLGYPDWPDGRTPLREAFAQRMAELHGWRAGPEHVREFTDISQALQAVLQLATEPGEGVAVHTPVFGPFTRGIASAGRLLVPIPMVDTGAGWEFDADRLADDLAAAGCRVLLLVNPHNPTGRVFTRAELERLAELAERHDLVVVSDEVHAELAYPPHRHIPFASLDSTVEARTVTLTSATKAFNLAGVRCAVAHVGPRRLRFGLAAQPYGLHGNVSILGVRATLAAWTEAGSWLAATLRYLEGNRRLVADTLAERLPEVGHHPPEATYLSWLDCRSLGWGDDPAATFRDRGRVELSAGPGFNPGGDGFARLNFATFTPVLRQILDRLGDAVGAGVLRAAA
jgi:cystathionine beta-lyase